MSKTTKSSHETGKTQKTQTASKRQTSKKYKVNKNGQKGGLTNSKRRKKSDATKVSFR